MADTAPDVPQIYQRHERPAVLRERREAHELAEAIPRFGPFAFAAVIVEGVERRSTRRLPRIEMGAAARGVGEDIRGILRPMRLHAEPFGFERQRYGPS